MMADARLQSYSDQIDKSLTETEKNKLNELGKTREYYENIVEQLSEDQN